jgi:hypothetical protein
MFLGRMSFHMTFKTRSRLGRLSVVLVLAAITLFGAALPALAAGTSAPSTGGTNESGVLPPLPLHDHGFVHRGHGATAG